MSKEMSRRTFVAGASTAAALSTLGGVATALASEASAAKDEKAGSAAAEAEPAPIVPGGPSAGIVRVTISVNDYEKSRSFFTNMLEFKEMATGILSPEEVKGLYGLEGGARYTMLKNEWQTTLVQLIEFEARTGKCIRTDRPSWDPGYFDVAMRCDDNKAVRDHLVKLGYSYYCEPHEYTTEWSGNTVSEAVACGVDDMPLTLIESVSEPRPEFEGLFKNITDVAQAVSDIDAADAFYGGVLGLTKVYDEEVVGLVDAILNLPANTPTRLAMYSVEGTPVVELIQMDIEGTPMSDVAKPENAGLFCTSFEVDDVAATLKACEDAGFAPHGDPVECFVAPYGTIDAAIVDGPDGMLVELFHRK
ncbi:MAG: VOC family protein [Coriobacteriia bacterium]|nr:VOC family protein [Coriobacteriia bacterium]